MLRNLIYKMSPGSDVYFREVLTENMWPNMSAKCTSSKEILFKRSISSKNRRTRYRWIAAGRTRYRWIASGKKYQSLSLTENDWIRRSGISVALWGRSYDAVAWICSIFQLNSPKHVNFIFSKVSECKYIYMYYIYIYIYINSRWCSDNTWKQKMCISMG